MTRPRDTVVIGVGNILRRDDGLGVHALRRLRAGGGLPGGVELVDGGTAGLMLLPHLADAGRAILVDAVDHRAPPGSLVRIDGSELPAGLGAGRTPHGVGLADLLGAARLTGAWPESLVVHGAQPASTALGADLTSPVARSLDALVARVRQELWSWAGGAPVATSRI